MPVVITFMSYYDHEPKAPAPLLANLREAAYTWRVRHINSYWCPTKAFMRFVMDCYKSNRLVSMCGSIDTPYCRACHNCETRYHQTVKQLRGE